MSTDASQSEATTPAAPIAAKPDKSSSRRGSNLQKPRRRYRAFNSFTMVRRIKRGTEAFKRYSGVSRLSPEQKDMIVYLSTTQHSNNSSRED